MLRNERFLVAMRFVENLASELATTAYIFGGFTADVYTGTYLRDHGDIDYLIPGFHDQCNAIAQSLDNHGWHVNIYLGAHLLSAKKDGIKLHLGHIEIHQEVVWKHNGLDGAILFPIEWLNKKGIPFHGIAVHVTEPELTYVLKTRPDLMNSCWTARDKDKADLQILEALILKKGRLPENDLSRIHVTT